MRCIKDSKTISLSKLKYNTEQNIENNMIVFMLQKFRYIGTEMIKINNSSYSNSNNSPNQKV